MSSCLNCYISFFIFKTNVFYRKSVPDLLFVSFLGFLSNELVKTHVILLLIFDKMKR